MSELNGVRMTNFVSRNQKTISSVSGAVAGQLGSIPEALKQLCYVLKNPDSITDMPTYVAATSAETAAVIAQFRIVQAMVDDYELVRDDPAQVDAVLAKHSLSIDSMSLDLVKG